MATVEENPRGVSTQARAGREHRIPSPAAANMAITGCPETIVNEA